MDALEALRDHGFHAEHAVPFAAQSRELPVPYSCPGNHDQRHLRLPDISSPRRKIDSSASPSGLESGHAALDAAAA